jgi:probable rRNA maturation factor
MTKRSIVVTISNQTDDASVDESRLQDAVTHVLINNGVDCAKVGVAIVSDRTILSLNRDYLQHDQTTDVLSFPLSTDAGVLEGEIAISLDTAAVRAKEYDWEMADELLLYAVHGALHLVGFRDASEHARAEMRTQEIVMLAHFGITPRYHHAMTSR